MYFNNCWVLKYAICVIMYCDVVNVQPHFNFSDEIIKLSWISNLSCITALSCVFDACVHQILLADYNTTKVVPYIWESLVCGSFSLEPNFWWCVLYPEKPTFNFDNSWTNFSLYRTVLEKGTHLYDKTRGTIKHKHFQQSLYQV